LPAALAKRYGGVTALRDVTLNAEPGQVHAVIGENGAGKSTFVKVLAGLVTPDHGEIDLAAHGSTSLTRKAASWRT